MFYVSLIIGESRESGFTVCFGYSVGTAGPAQTAFTCVGVFEAILRGKMKPLYSLEGAKQWEEAESD